MSRCVVRSVFSLPGSYQGAAVIAWGRFVCVGGLGRRASACRAPRVFTVPPIAAPAVLVAFQLAALFLPVALRLAALPGGMALARRGAFQPSTGRGHSGSGRSEFRTPEVHPPPWFLLVFRIGGLLLRCWP